MLSFRKTTSEDLDAVLRMEQKFSTFVGQWTRGEHEAALYDPCTAHLSFYDDEAPLLGYAILRSIHQSNRSIELMRIAIDCPGEGYGKQALRLILRWCFEEQNAHRVWLDVRSANTRAQHVYKTMGFIPEGTLRDAVYVNGAFESLMVLSILEGEYRRQSL